MERKMEIGEWREKNEERRMGERRMGRGEWREKWR